MKTLQEYLIDVLRSTPVYEMAKNQDRCEDNVRSQVNNILENLTLINYFRISGLHTTNINHWKDELDAAMHNAADFTVKKDRSIDRRMRIIQRVFKEEDATDIDKVLYKVQCKFKKEEETMYPSHSRSQEWLDEAIMTSIRQLTDVASLIAMRNARSQSVFIQNL